MNEIRKSFWLCRCECGNEVEVRGNDLNGGRTRSCGCLLKENYEKRFKDIKGKRFGKWEVLSLNSRGDGFTKWNCKCDCGTYSVISGNNLRMKHSQSCGCYKNVKISERNTTHGKSKSKLYKAFMMMHQRCYNSKNPNFKDYGGRGIGICKEWSLEEGFDRFYSWSLENGHAQDLSLDRIDVNGNYEPTNCRWATFSTQQNNKRKSVYLEIDGVIKTLQQWSNQCGVSCNVIKGRMNRGKSGIELITPVIKKIPEKVSGVTGVNWSRKGKAWNVFYKRKYIGFSKDLEEAINIKNKYIKNLRGC